jgi:putative phage-type endonuclease
MTKTASAQSFDPIERRKYLGASEIACVMGLDKYKTPLDLFNEKLGLCEPFAGNSHTQRGNALEAIAASFFTEQTGKQVRRRNEAFVHPDHPFIVGHIDRVIVGEKHLLEIKAPSLGAFRKYQREGLPQSYLIQANAYMGLSKYPQLTFCIFCADAWDAAVFTLQFDKTIYDAAVEAAVGFWTNHVETGVPPQFAGVSDDKEYEIAKVGGSLTVREDERFCEAAQLYLEALQIERDACELKELATNRLKEAIENEYGCYEGGGIRLYFKQQKGRTTFDKKALAAKHPEIDLSQFEKTGKPFDTLRVYAGGK